MKNKVTKWQFILVCVCCLFLFAGCQKEETKEPEVPVDSTKVNVKESMIEVADYTEYDYDRAEQDMSRKMKFHSASNSSGSTQGNGSQDQEETNDQPAVLTDPEIHFLNGAAEADCAVIVLPDGKILLYNAGSTDEDFGDYLRKYLNAMKVKTIDYLVLSSYDDQRIGQLDMLAENFDTSKAQVFVKGAVMEGNNDKPVRDEMKAFQSLDAAAYGNYMNAMRILREKYGEVTFINGENHEVSVGGLSLEFFNTDYSSYKNYQDWTLCCRMSYKGASVVFLGGASTNVLDQYASQLEKSNAVRVSGHMKSCYSTGFYESLAPQLVVSQIPEMTAENTLVKSELQNFFQEQGIHSYVTGMSRSEVVLRLAGGQALIANGVQPTTVEFEGYWTDWID